ncbi:MAG: hypothetical protein HRT70_08465 [Flavobacteriaceae bacterium]|nr:hypothetical protein [Flavobacteriaceae bacterium]
MPNETLNDVVRRVIDNYQKLTESTKRVPDLQAFTSKSGLLFDLIKEVINKQDRMEQEVLAVLQIQTEIMSQMREDQSKITDHLQSFDVISEQ